MKRTRRTPDPQTIPDIDLGDFVFGGVGVDVDGGRRSQPPRSPLEPESPAATPEVLDRGAVFPHLKSAHPTPTPTPHVNTPNVHGLTRKREMFCREYVTDLDHIRAAKDAGYKAKRAGVRLMRDERVLWRITELMAQRAARLNVTADRVMNELAAIAFFDWRNVVNHDGSLKKIKDLGSIESSALSGVEVIRCKSADADGNEVWDYDVKRITSYSKLNALEMIGKHIGMFDERFHGSIEHRHRLEMDRQVEYLSDWPANDIRQLKELLKKNKKHAPGGSDGG